MWMARLDAGIANAATGLMERKLPGRQKQNLYLDTYGSMVKLAINKLTKHE